MAINVKTVQITMTDSEERLAERLAELLRYQGKHRSLSVLTNAIMKARDAAREDGADLVSGLDPDTYFGFAAPILLDVIINLMSEDGMPDRICGQTSEFLMKAALAIAKRNLAGGLGPLNQMEMAAIGAVLTGRAEMIPLDPDDESDDEDSNKERMH